MMLDRIIMDHVRAFLYTVCQYDLQRHVEITVVTTSIERETRQGPVQVKQNRSKQQYEAGKESEESLILIMALTQCYLNVLSQAFYRHWLFTFI